MPYDPKLGPGNPYLIDEAKGLVYQIGSDGKRHYVSPAAMTPAQLRESQMGLPHDPANFFDTSTIPKGGVFKGRGEWDPDTGEFEQPTNWGNLMGLGIGAGIGGLALPAILGGAGGGGAAASSVLPSTEIGSTIAGGSLGMGGIPGAALAGGAGTAAGAVLPSTELGSTVAGGSMGMDGAPGATVAGGAAGGASALRQALTSSPDLLKTIAALGTAIPPIISGLRGPSESQQALEDAVRRLLELQEGRMKQQQPLFSSVNQGVFRMLPLFARGGAGDVMGG